MRLDKLIDAELLEEIQAEAADMGLFLNLTAEHTVNGEGNGAGSFQ